MSIGPYGMTKTEYSRYQRARDERDAARIAEIEAAAKAEALNKLENERLSEERKARLDAERKAKVDQADQAYEASLPKEQIAAKWLVDHPDRSREDFEQLWPEIVKQLRAADEQEALEVMRRRMRAEIEEDDSAPVPVNWSWDQRRSRALDSGL